MNRWKMTAAAAALAAGLFNAGSALAVPFGGSFGWEDGTSTVLGSFGSNFQSNNVASGQMTDYGAAAGDPVVVHPVAPFEGNRMLELIEQPQSGTPRGYLLFIENLALGDTVNYTFRHFDPTDGRSPSTGTSVTYATSGDINSFGGFATPVIPFSTGTGWLEYDVSFTIGDGAYTAGVDDAVVIRADLFSASATPSNDATYFYVDALTVNIDSSSPTAQVTMPDGTVIPVPEPASLGLVALAGVSLLRRRRD